METCVSYWMFAFIITAATINTTLISYLSKSQHLMWGILEKDGELSQVSGIFATERTQRARSISQRFVISRLIFVLHLLWRVK